MTHPGIEAIRVQIAESGFGRGGLEVERARAQATAATNPPPAGVRIEPDTLGGRPAEWLVPEGSGGDGVIVYLHGGGYVMDGIDTHRNLAGRLALASGRSVVLLDYRLAPEHHFPTPVDDVRAALRDLSDRGIGTDRVALAGDSAGGGLALAVLGALVTDHQPTPAAAAVLSPWTDLTLSAPSVTALAEADPLCTAYGLRLMAAAYLGDTDPRNPLASPRFTDPEVLAGFPPLMIEVGGQEILLDDAVDVAEAARAAGVEVVCRVWDEMLHVFQAFPPELVPESAESIDATGAFLARHLP